MKRFAMPLFFTLLAAVALVAFFVSVQWTPEAASQQATEIDRLLRLLFIIAAIILAFVMTFLIYAVVVFRRQPGDLEDATGPEGNNRLEFAWTIVPFFIVLGIGIYSADLLLKISASTADEPDLVVDVTGFQWAWSFEYPDYGITSGELVLPVDQTVLFRLHAKDVIHSFFIPEFRLKMDNIPGIVNEVRIRPTRIGEYKVRCAEMCGTGHAYMLAPVRVVDQESFAAWVQSRSQPAAATEAQPEAAAPEAAVDPVARGQALAQQYGCIACHSTDGSQLVGPTWLGLYGEEVALADGSVVVADDEYLRLAILEPGAQLVAGYQNVMPAIYKDQLSDEDVEALIAYIKSLH